MSFTFLNQLPTPEEIKRDYPLTPELAELKKQRDAMIHSSCLHKQTSYNRRRLQRYRIPARPGKSTEYGRRSHCYA